MLLRLLSPLNESSQEILSPAISAGTYLPMSNRDHVQSGVRQHGALPADQASSTPSKTWLLRFPRVYERKPEVIGPNALLCLLAAA